ncbi:MAG: MFS transporter, partial [Anaerolineae bacterium]
LGVLSTASYGLVRGFWPFLSGRLAWGMAWTCINVGGRAMLVDVSTRSNRGRLTGIFNTWLQAGFVLSPLVGGFLVDAISFRPAMLACSGLTAVGLAVAVLAVPETAVLSREEAQAESPLVPRLALQPHLEGLSWKRIRGLFRRNRVLVTVSLLLLIVLFAGNGVALSTVSLLLQRRLGSNVVLGRVVLGVASAGGILLALRSLLAGAVGPLVGHLSDAPVGRWPVIVGSLVIGFAGFGLLSFAACPATILLGVALGAVSGGAALAALGAQMGDLTPPGREGVVMGAYATVGDIGSMAGPFIAFAMVSQVGLRWVYLLCALCFLAGLLLIWRLGPSLRTSLGAAS